jgi:DNA-binding transcriptional MocR family regulator
MPAEPQNGRWSRYRDIAAKLEKQIRLGNHPVGELLPTETELMAQHSASRQTVRQALRILMNQGLIVRRAGLGSVVIATEPPVLFTHSVKSLAEWLGYSSETYRGMPATLAKTLQVKAGSPALTVIRRYYGSGRAVRGYGNDASRRPLHLHDGHGALAATVRLRRQSRSRADCENVSAARFSRNEPKPTRSVNATRTAVSRKDHAQTTS